MSILFKNCRIIDGKGNTIPSGFLMVEGERILTIGGGKVPQKARDTEVFDLRGGTLLPGLIDSHVHLCLDGSPDPMTSLRQDSDALMILKAAKQAYLTLLAGVTTVRDLGARNDLNIALREAIAAGITRGPRIIASGRTICMTGGHGWPMSREADGEADMRKAVREQIKAGADVIKMIATGGVLTPGSIPGAPQLTHEELKAGVEEAHKGNRKVASHVQGAEGIRNSLKAGIDSIEHGIFLDRETIKMFPKNATLVPTLAAPFFILKNGLEGGIPAPIIEKTNRVAEAHLDSARKAYRAGIPIAMGTDAGTPFNLHGENLKELELLCGIGLTPMEAIISATLTAARVLDREQEIGTLEKGKRADLIVVEGNPLEDISLLQKKDRIRVIMKDGRFYKKTIDAAGTVGKF